MIGRQAPNQLVIPAEWLATEQHLDEVTSERSLELDQIRLWICTWLEEHADIQPEWLRERTE